MLLSLHFTYSNINIHIYTVVYTLYTYGIHRMAAIYYIYMALLLLLLLYHWYVYIQPSVRLIIAYI